MHPKGGNDSSATVKTTCAPSKYRTLAPHTPEIVEDKDVLNDFKRDSGKRVCAEHIQQPTSANQLHVSANHGSAYRMLEKGSSSAENNARQENPTRFLSAPPNLISNR